MEYIKTNDDGFGPLSVDYTFDFVASSSVTILMGWFVRHYVKSTIYRKIIGSALGLMTAFAFGGLSALYLLVTPTITLLWMLMPAVYKRNMTGIFVTCALMVVLRVFYRYSSLLIGITTSEVSLTKPMHMYCTLRCISITYEIFVFHVNKTRSAKIHPAAPEALEKEPNIFDVFCYTTFAPALCIGPFYTFQTFLSYVTTPREKLSKEIPYRADALKKVFHAVCLFGVFWAIITILFDYMGFDINYEDYDSFKNIGFVRRMLFVLFTIIQTTTYLYFCWRLGECCCVMWGIGAYKCAVRRGQGPVTSLKDHHDSMAMEWNYITIDNGDAHKWFLLETPGDVMKSWNVTVQWWLVRYCYTTELIPRKFRFIRFAYMQVVNVLWHGGRPGCWVALMSGPIVLQLQYAFIAFVQNHFTTKFGNVVAYLCKCVTVNWVMFPFLMLPFVYPLGTMKDFLLFTAPEVFAYCIGISLLAYVVDLLARFVNFIVATREIT